MYDATIGDMVVAGLPFFENFVTVYDYSLGKVRLGLNANAIEGASVVADPHRDPVIEKLKEFSGWALAAIIIGVVVTALLLICCLGYLCYMQC